MEWRARNDWLFALSVYEVHLGSARNYEGRRALLTYRELADQLIPYLKQMSLRISS
jgi:1,4-alpha-glucan branching enzyme